MLSKLIERLRRPSPAPVAPAAPAPKPNVGLYEFAKSGWFQRDAGRLFHDFPVGPDDHVLDVGCGDGGFALFCGRQGAAVTLADIDSAKLAGAERRLREAGLTRLQAVQAGAGPLPLADAGYNRILALEVLEHVDSPVDFLADLVRLGQPGALYLIAVPDQVSEELQRGIAPASYFEPPHHIRIVPRGELPRLAAQAGLEVVSEHVYGFYWALWWLLYWQCGGADDPAQHPVLQDWTRTWQRVLDLPDGLEIKRRLDAVLPKSRVVVARKPG